MNLGNAEVDFAELAELFHFGMDVQVLEDTATVLLWVRDSRLASDHIMDIVRIVGRLRADECSMEGTRLRLWWD